MKQKIVLTMAHGLFSIVVAFFATMSLYPLAHEKNKVFLSIAALAFLVIELPIKGEA